MIFRPTNLVGAAVIELERIADERGFFARNFCREEFRAAGLDFAVAQCNVSFSPRRGTLRGMHYQVVPRAEAKLIRCTRGAAWDCLLDLRPGSPTYKHHFAMELTEANRLSLYLPPGVAHGYLTLSDNTELFYLVSEFYSPEHARGVRWDDPAFGIPWPFPPEDISEKDRSWVDYRS